MPSQPKMWTHERMMCFDLAVEQPQLFGKLPKNKNKQKQGNNNTHVHGNNNGKYNETEKKYQQKRINIPRRKVGTKSSSPKGLPIALAYLPLGSLLPEAVDE